MQAFGIETTKKDLIGVMGEREEREERREEKGEKMRNKRDTAMYTL